MGFLGLARGRGWLLGFIVVVIGMLGAAGALAAVSVSHVRSEPYGLAVTARSPFASSPGALRSAARRLPGFRSWQVAGVTGRQLQLRRRVNSDTFVVGGGRLVTRIYPYAINYRTRGGRLAAIDPRLVRSRAGFVQRANDLGVQLPASAAGMARVSNGSGGFGFRLEGARGVGRVTGAAERFAASGLVFASSNQGVAWQATTSDASAARGLRWVLRPSRGLRVRLGRRGVVLVNRRGRVVWVFSAPAAHATSSPQPLATRLSLTRSAGQTVVWIRLAGPRRRFGAARVARSGRSAGRVRAPARPGAGVVHADAVTWGTTVYPGNVSYLGASQQTGDCYVDSGSATTSFCQTSTNYVGPNDHALLNFNLSGAIPDHSTVLQAFASMDLTSASSTTPETVGVWQAAKPWTNSATWNTYDGTHAWSTPGGDVTGAVADTQSIGASSDVGQHFYWDIDQIMQGWVDGNPAADDGLLFALTGSGSNKLGFATQTSSSVYPYLDVYWQPRIGDYLGARFDRQTLTDRSSLGVNVASGNALYTADDIHLAGVNGLDLNLDRYYNNLSPDQGSLGRGWTMATGPDTYLVVPSDSRDTLDYYDGTGQAVPFYENPSGQWVIPSGVDVTPSMNQSTAYASTSFSLYFRHVGITETFSASANTLPKYARLASLSDRNGNTISYSYNSSGQLTTIQDSFGDTTTFTWTGGYITQITDPTGRVYTYAQNASGQLASYTDPDHNTTSYSYDGYGNLTQITTGDGNITNVAYDTGASERATSITRLVNPSDSTGPTTSYAYAGASGPCTGDSGWKETTVTDPDSHHTTYCADDLGRIASVTDANGNLRSTAYTPDGYIKTLTSAQNTPETFTYSADGKDNVTQIQDGTGSGSTTTSLQYNDTTNQYQPTQSTDAQSNNTNYAYDANGNLKTITDQLGSQNQASLTYNSDGTVASSKDADGNTTTYGYTGHLLTTITPPSGSGLNPISLQYDGDKRVIEISSVSGSSGHEVDYTYDSEDRVNTATYKDASGTIVAALGYDDDPDGNLQERDDNAGATNFAYDGLNRLTDAKYPDSSTDHYDYDAASNLTGLTDAGGKVTYGYDPANQLTSVLDPGASTATALAYDADGNLKTVTYPGGSSISRTYNALDQLTNVSDTYQTGGSPYSITRAITYNGNLQSTVTDQTGNKTTYTYDALNRLTDAKVMNGSTPVRDNAYSLDGNGNITKSTLNGTTSTSYAYNPGNEICWSYTGASTNGCGSPPSGAYSYSYDPDGQQTSNGNATTMAYNALGQMTSQTVSGTTTSFAYLGAGQDELIGDGTSTLHNDILGLASTTPSGSSSTYYTRNINGQHLDERTPSGTYYYLYDGNNNVIGLTDSSGHLARAYNYDPYGNNTYSTGTTANPFGFQDGYQTSTGLYHYGARYENPGDARWTQQDPLTHISDLTQEDRYAFVGDDPGNASDPTGEGPPEDASTSEASSRYYGTPGGPTKGPNADDVCAATSLAIGVFDPVLGVLDGVSCIVVAHRPAGG